MDKIKKKFKFDGNEKNFIINLNNEFIDIGFYTDSKESSNIDIEMNNKKNVQGLGLSRLNELKKYNESSDISEKYIISNNNGNGVILNESDNNKITYIIDNIKFIDDLNDGSTIFSYIIPEQYEDLSNNILIKEDKFLKYSSYREEKDLDIVRQSLNIFESHIRLTDIRNVEELTLYGGGYYNIFRNS